MNINLRNKRKYIHSCINTGISSVTLNTEICPDCGQTGRFSGWSLSMTEAMGRYQKLTGLPAAGIHRRFLPVLSSPCEACNGEGFVESNLLDDDQPCPKCNGLEKSLVPALHVMKS